MKTVVYFVLICNKESNDYLVVFSKNYRSNHLKKPPFFFARSYDLIGCNILLFYDYVLLHYLSLSSGSVTSRLHPLKNFFPLSLTSPAD